MKPIKPIFLKRNNNREKVTVLVFLLVFSFIVLLASMVKGQEVYNRDNILKNGNATTEYANNSAIVRWNIAVDSKYHFFIIERTKDKIHYEFVSMVKATDVSFYAIVDANILGGNTFYRISATDLKNEPVRLFEVPFSAPNTALAK